MVHKFAFASAAAGGAAIGSMTTTLALWLLGAVSGRPLGVSPIVFLFVFALLVSLLCVFTVGLAWHIFVQAHGWTGAAIYVAPAAFGGFLLCAGLAWFLVIWGEDEGAPQLTVLNLVGVMAYGIALGAVTGLAAWLIRRPDRDSPNPAKPTP